MTLTTKQQVGVAVFAAIGVAALFFQIEGPQQWLFTTLDRASVSEESITNFDECARYYPVLESYPEQCRTPEGKSFTRDIGNELNKIDNIRSATPRPGEVIESPYTLEGEARGVWFFEADAPIALYDGDGVLIAESYISVSEGATWMTESFVPYEGALSFTPPETDRGTLVLKKANASGLPEHDDELIIPIRFR